MRTLATILCLAAIAAVQVPSVACAASCGKSQCGSVIVSAAHEHDCDALRRAANEARSRAHAHSKRGCGHSSCSGHAERRGVQKGDDGEQAPDAPEKHSHGNVHEVLQGLVVKHHFRVEVPAHDRAHHDLPIAETTVALPAQSTVLEAAHRAEPDPVPVPPPASVRLLL